MPEPIEVRKVPIRSVSDASGLAGLIDDGVLDADRVVAVIGKTEGNGGVNDYTRIIADRAFREVLVAKGTRSAEEVAQVPIVWSGGTDGVLSPHATVFATVPADRAEPTDEPRLTVGFAMSEVLLPEDIGRTAMVTKVADAVRVAMERAGITDVADVHYVQTKTPLLTIHTISDAKRRGQTVWTEHTHESMDLSNGVHGAGRRGRARRDRDALRRGRHARPVAVLRRRVLLLRRRARPGAGGGGRQRPRRRRALPDRALGDARRAGRRRHLGARSRMPAWSCPSGRGPRDLDGRLVNVFLKCEVSQDGLVHGRRNAMLDDSDVHWHRQIKSAVGGVTAVVTGDPAVFVSVSAAHQGPDGGGPVAAIVDLGPDPTGYVPPA